MGSPINLVELRKRLEDCVTGYVNIKDKFGVLVNDGNTSFERLSKIAAEDFVGAIEKLKPLATSIRGKTATAIIADDAVKEAVAQLTKAFDKAKVSSESTLTDANKHEAELIQLRNADLMGIPNGLLTKTESLDADVSSAIDRTTTAITAQETIVKEADKRLEEQEGEYNRAKEKYDKAKSRYDTMKNLGPLTLLTGVFGIIGGAIIAPGELLKARDNAETKKTTAKTVADTARDIQQKQKQQLEELQQLKKDLKTLSDDVKLKIQTVLDYNITVAETCRKAAHSLSVKVLSLWAHTTSVANDADAAEWAFTKAAYATAILRTLDKAQFDPTTSEITPVKKAALEILQELKDGDDAQGTVANIPISETDPKSWLQHLTEKYGDIKLLPLQ